MMSNIIIDKLNQTDSEICNRKDSVISFDSALTKNTDTAVQISEQHILRADTFLKYEDNDGEEYYIAKVWAAKLKHLDSEQRLLAEKAIHDVLFEARLGNLNKTSVKINEGKRRVKRINSSLYNSIVSKSLSNSKTSIENSNEIKNSEFILTESFPGVNEIMNLAKPEPPYFKSDKNILDVDDITDTDVNKKSDNTDTDITDISQHSHQQSIIVAANANKMDDSSITTSGNESYDSQSQYSKTLSSTKNPSQYSETLFTKNTRQHSESLSPTKYPCQNSETLSTKNPSQNSETCSTTKKPRQNSETCPSTKNPSQNSETCSSTKSPSQNSETCSSTNMATISPSILCQLSRYMTHLYNNCKSYIPE